MRRGVLSVTGGQEIAIATREAVPGDDLATLDETVLARFRADTEAERTERVDSTRLQLNAIRQIMQPPACRRRRLGGLRMTVPAPNRAARSAGEEAPACAARRARSAG